jgi:hypothetical protein
MYATGALSFLASNLADTMLENRFTLLTILQAITHLLDKRSTLILFNAEVVSDESMKIGVGL